MRVAIAPTGKVGLRAGRALLADAGLTGLGVLGARARSTDPRVQEISTPAGWQLLLTDARPDDDRLLRAAELGLPLVMALPPDESYTGPVLSLAAWETGLTAAVAVDLINGFDHVVTVDATFTSAPARIRKRGSAHFPAPVGPLWHEPVAPPVDNPHGVRFNRAPYEGELAGITARAEGDIDGRRTTVTRGVVDDPDYLAAIALAGAAKLVIDQGGWDRQSQVNDHAAAYLAACENLGLEMATFRAVL